MARYEFESVFADEIQNYINDKKSAGFNGANFRRNLISFDRFCIEQEIKKPVFTTYCKCQYKNVGKVENNNVGFSTYSSVA